MPSFTRKTSRKAKDEDTPRGLPDSADTPTPRMEPRPEPKETRQLPALVEEPVRKTRYARPTHHTPRHHLPNLHRPETRKGHITAHHAMSRTPRQPTHPKPEGQYGVRIYFLNKMISRSIQPMYDQS